MNSSIFRPNSSKVRLLPFVIFLFVSLLFIILEPNTVFCANQKSALKWGPIMGLISPEDANIKWTTTLSATCSVICNGQTIAVTKSTGIFHEIFLQKLTPATSYEYYILVDDSNDSEKAGPFFFKTPPEHLTNWSFLVYGDTRGNNQDPNASTNNIDHEKVIKAMERLAHSNCFCIHTGDLVDRGERYDNWDKFFQIVEPLSKKLPILPIRGNHDISPEIFSNIFYSPLSEGSQKNAWYGFRFGNAQFVFLDMSLDGKNDVKVNLSKLKAQIPFLERVLEQANNDNVPWKFVVLHQPPFSSGRYGCNDTLIAELVPIFEKYQVTCCFSAHCHLYERSFKNGVTYIVSGGGGAPFQEPPGSKPNANSVFGTQSHHFLTVDVSPEAVNFTVYAPNGEVIDSFNQKTAGLPKNPCWSPAQPSEKNSIIITSKQPGKLHWGVNGWTLPPLSTWPEGSEKWSDGKAIETQLIATTDGKVFQSQIGPFQNISPRIKEINCVFHYADNTWGKDFKITVNP